MTPDIAGMMNKKNQHNAVVVPTSTTTGAPWTGVSGEKRVIGCTLAPLGGEEKEGCLSCASTESEKY